MKSIDWIFAGALTMSSLTISVTAMAGPSSAAEIALGRMLVKLSDGDLAAVKAYRAEHGDLNAANKYGMTPLMQAAATGRKNIVSYLLQQKVNLEAKNQQGDTALAMALGNEQDDIAVQLIRAGASLDELSGNEQSSLLFKATSVNAQKTLALLLTKAPAQLNQPNKNGDTPLHEAARYGSEETLKTLLKAGAKKDLKNAAGKTPLDIAKAQKNATAAKLLQ